jgi:hypothetical protein
MRRGGDKFHLGWRSIIPTGGGMSGAACEHPTSPGGDAGWDHLSGTTQKGLPIICPF